jgi:hypothetical protein
MGLESRIERLEQNLNGEVGPPPQEYYDARERRGRYVRALMAPMLEGELAEEERNFKDRYEGSDLKENDGQLIQRYAPPRSTEEAAEVRTRIKAALDEIAKMRREREY